MNAKLGVFDPAPLLRQLELTLPDQRESPLRVRENTTNSAHCAAEFDGGRKVVAARQIAEALGVSRRSVGRYRQGARLRIDQADALAVRCGLHPANLWPEWYEATT